MISDKVWDQSGTGMITAKSWNAAFGQADSGYFRVGAETSMGSGGNLPPGRLANRGRMVDWKGRHPYAIHVFWNSDFPLTPLESALYQRESGMWCAQIVPGLLNGHPPALKMKGKYLPPDAEVWGNKYGAKAIDPEQDVQVLLTDDPQPIMKIFNYQDTRAKTYGGDGGVTAGKVPLYFRARGAMKPESLTGLDVLGNIIAGGGSEFALRLIGGEAEAPRAPREKDDELPEGNRLLYQADVVLQVDRPSVAQDFVYDDLGILRHAGFSIKLPQHDQYSARIYHIGKYVPPKPPTYWDIIFGTYIELPYDEIVLGTIYLFSPVMRDHDIPDGSWQGYAAHNVFWNLTYASIMQIDPFKPDTSLEYFKQIGAVLAGGTAFLIIASMVNPLEASFDTVNTLFNQTAVKGQFWTG
jgi:hypothetical protein